MARRPDRVALAIKRLPPAELRRFMDSVAAILYWDSENNAWDPNQEWDSASDFLDMINENIPESVLDAIRRR